MEVFMTYKKRCRNKSSKVASLTLSMIMLGSASSPAIKILGEEYGRIHAEESIKDDSSTNLKIGYSDEKGEVEKGGTKSDFVDDESAYKKKMTVFSDKARDRSYATYVFGMKPVIVNKEDNKNEDENGVGIELYSVDMDRSERDYKNKVFTRIDKIIVDGQVIDYKGSKIDINEDVDGYGYYELDARFELRKNTYSEGQSNVLRTLTIKDNSLYAAYKAVEEKKGNHKFAIVFADGSVLRYMTGDKKPDNITLADYYKNAVKSVVGNGSSIEVNLLGFDEKGDEVEQAHKALVYDFIPHINGISINGHSQDMDEFVMNAGGKDLMNIPDSDDKEVVRYWNFEVGKKNTVVFSLDDGSEITWTGEVGEKIEPSIPNDDAKELEGLETIDVGDIESAPDGQYTIGFEARYADGRKGTSMLQGFFDRNIMIEKKGGKLKAKFLNLFFANGLLDFRIKNTDGTWPEMSKKDPIGNSGEQAYFTMDIKDLKEVHEGAVLVSYMGGKLDDLGKMDEKYTKVKIIFKKEAHKGWKNFHEVYDLENKKAMSKDILRQRLIRSGLDTNSDGKISSEELTNAPATVDLTWKGGVLEPQFNKIYDIDILKDLGANVKVIRLNSNGLTSLPKGIFDKAVNLEEVWLNGNKISNIPKDIFKNNTKLKKVSLASNPVTMLDEGLFANNHDLELIDLENTMISEVKPNTFKNLKKLTDLKLGTNNLSILDDNIFSDNKALVNLEINNNALTSIPSSLRGASRLEKLILSQNRLTSLPEFLSGFDSLKNVDLSFNKVSNVSKSIWDSFAKKEGLRIDLTHNDLTSLPDISEPKYESLNVAYNLLPSEISTKYENLKVNKSVKNGYYAQRTPVKYKLEAKNGKITFNQTSELGIVDLYNWENYVVYKNEDLFTEAKYKERRESDIGQTLKNQGTDFKVVTRIEEVKGDITKTVYEKESINKVDEKTDTGSDKRMKNNGKYRLTKQFFIMINGEWIKMVELTKDTIAIVDANFKPEGKESENSQNSNKELKYTLPVRLVKFREESSPSMGANAMNDTIEVVETRDGIKMTLGFHAMDLELAGKQRRGHLYKMAVYDSVDDAAGKDYEIVDTLEEYVDSGRKFPGKVTFTRYKRGEKKIGIRVWVDAMDDIARETGNTGDASQPAVLIVDWSKAPKESVVDKDAKEKSERRKDSSEDLLASKTLLNNSLSIANKLIDAGVIEGRSKDLLEKAIQKANEALKSNNRMSIATANEIILFAIDNIKKESGLPGGVDNSKVLDIKQLDQDMAKEIGKGAKLYSVPVKLWHAYDNKASMGDGSLIKKAVVSEKDGKYTYYVDFKGMEFMGMHGHLWGLGIYESGPNSSVVPAKVEKEVEDKDLNGSMRKFPSRYSFVKSTKENEVYAEVNVDAMDSMSSNAKSYDAIVKGSGKQKAKFMFDWSNAKEFKEGVQGASSPRLAGTDRYETSTKISQKYFDRADTVVLASGFKNADALVSASLASVNQGPILLTRDSSVPASTKAEITRLGAKRVILAGGTSSIGYKVEEELKSMGLSIERKAGANRYATAASIGQLVKDKSGSNKVILINGEKDADALTVSSLATEAGIPVLMTRSGVLDANARAKINQWKPDEVIVVGGRGSISDRVLNQINAKSKIRVAGANRFETSLVIANKVYPNAETIFIANGRNSVDALSAGAVTGIAKAPIVLVEKDNVNSSVIGKLKSTKGLIILGGESTVSSKAIDSIK